MRALLVLVLVAPAYAALAGQRQAAEPAEAATRIVRGQVRSDDDSATFLRRVGVTVAGNSAAVFTDQQGRFEVAVPASTGSLRLTKPGFAATQIRISTATTTELLQIRMARGAAITGRVVDDLGGPAVAVSVRVRRLVDPQQQVATAFTAAIETDDLGEFRIGSLPAGDYEVSLDSRQVQIDELAMPAILRGLPAQRQSVRERGDRLEPASVRLRTGEEVSGTILYRDGGAEARAAAEYASAYEARQPAQVVALPRPGTFTTVRGTAAVVGRVTGPNGRAVAGAIVRLDPASPGRPRLAATNTEGQFQIGNVIPGAYRLVAAKSGLVDGEHGQSSAGRPGNIVTLRERQRLERADIRLWRGGVVTGTVTDADGEPLEGLAMHVWRLRFWSGRRITEAATDVSVRRSDDRGQYRLHGLQPGTYYLVAANDPSASSRAVTGAPRSYYPGTPMIGEALPLRIDVGVDADVHMTFNPARTWRLEGTAKDSEGNPLQQPLVLAGSTRAGVTVVPQTATMSGDRFVFEHVLPGSYVIHAIQRRQLSDRLVQEFAMRFVEVIDYDTAGLLITTSKGTTVAGRILTEGDRAPGAGTLFPFDIVSADPDFAPPPGQFQPWTVRFIAGGYFQIDGLSGPVRFTSAAPDGWFLKSVDIGGRNAVEEPVTFGTPNDWRGQVNVVFSSAGAKVSGRVVNGRNEPVATYGVVALPVDRDRWYSGSAFIRTAHPDEEARFALGTLPPGDYWIAALDSLPDGSLEDPELLARLSAIGRRVALSAGQRLVTDLSLVTLRR
jgi:hypothetical protein